MSLDPLVVARQLIAINSVTSDHNHTIADLMTDQLRSLGFAIERIPYVDIHNIDKIAIVAKRGHGLGGLVYCCHNDVVSVDGWSTRHGGPFDGVVADDKLWGRGSCDMKGSIACALAAVSRIAIAEQQAPLYFLVTGDEESGMQGARTISSLSKYFVEMTQHKTVGIIGEPTELRLVNSHKGGCLVSIQSHGVAAHSSTADGRNANWQLIPFLTYLHDAYERSLQDPSLINHRFSPPTLSMNVVLSNEPAAKNITVGKATCEVFLRLMPEVAWSAFVDEIVSEAKSRGLHIASMNTLLPVHTPEDSQVVQEILNQLDQAEPLAVSFATDGCGLHALKELVVLGPGSIEQAHRPDEWISLEQLRLGTDVFERLFRKFTH